MKLILNSFFVLILIGFSSSFATAQFQLGGNLNGEDIDEKAGHSISLSKDGNRVAIASPGFKDGNGRVQVYEFDGSQWIQLGNDIKGVVPWQNVGVSISLSGDGNRLVVAAMKAFLIFEDGIGRLSAYDWNGQEWIITHPNIEVLDDYSYTQENIKISLSEEGNHLLVATRSDFTFEQYGQVKVYERTENNWIQKGNTLNGKDEFNDFGASIDVSSDGNLILIGDPLEDSGSSVDLGTIRTYEWNDSLWVQKGQRIKGTIPDSEIGTFATLSPDGNYIAFSERSIGFLNNLFIVKVLKWDGNAWMAFGDEFNPFTASQSIVGNFLRLDISANGKVLVIADPEHNTGGAQQGRIVIYQKSENQWTQVEEMLSGSSDGDKLGTTIALSNDGKNLALGSPFVADNGANSGQVRIFALDGITSTNYTAIKSIDVYPNPTSGTMYLKDAIPNRVIVFDQLGRSIIDLMNPGTELDFSNFASGVYFMQLFMDDGVQAVRIIKE